MVAVGLKKVLPQVEKEDGGHSLNPQPNRQPCAFHELMESAIGH